MQQKYLIQQHHDTLILFFAGWAADEHLFAGYTPQEADLMICYDYRHLTFDASSLAAYRTIQVYAWSMGVWAASHVLPTLDLPVQSSLAINGTPYPIDDARGIPEAVFQGTLSGLDPRNMKKFQRRMSATSAAHRVFMERIPQRPLDEIAAELACIAEQVGQLSAPTWRWTKAIVGKQDHIIPPENQLKAWQELAIPVEQRDIAHYDEPLFATLLR